MSKTISGYCTKYALTKGIFEIRNVEVSQGKYVRRGFGHYVIGKEFFERVEDAEADAIKRAKAKIASLDKQREKLEELAKSPKWKAVGQ